MPLSSLLIKRAVESDLECLQKIGRQTFKDSLTGMVADASMDAYLNQAFHRKLLQDALENPQVRFYLLFDRQTCVGYARINLLQSENDKYSGAEIERFYLLASHHGTGASDYFMKFLLSQIRTKNISAAWLGVW